MGTPKRFQLWVKILDWHDGDTAHAVLDQGYWTYRGATDKPVRVRCALINAPELDTPAGPPARDFAAQLAPPGDYPCWSYKPDPDNYGRPLLDLILPDGRLFSTVMLEAGHAIPYTGGSR